MALPTHYYYLLFEIKNNINMIKKRRKKTAAILLDATVKYILNLPRAMYIIHPIFITIIIIVVFVVVK